MTREDYEFQMDDTKKYHNGTLTGLDVASMYITSLEQRIAELEAHKTCDVGDNFYCSYYEPKETSC